VTPTEVDRERIAARYPSPKRRWLVPVLAVPILALLVYYLWLSAFHSNPPLTAQVTGFRVDSDSAITVGVMVDRARPEVSGQCLVYAQAVNHERVGEVWMPVPASDRKVEYLAVTIRTFRLATTASLDHCTTR
jgi:hypothetical protein